MLVPQTAVSSSRGSYVLEKMRLGQGSRGSRCPHVLPFVLPICFAFSIVLPYNGGFPIWPPERGVTGLGQQPWRP